MKYSHGTDSEQRDRLMVWANRFMAGLFIGMILLLIFFLIYFIVTGESLLFSLLSFVLIGIFTFPVLDCIWSNGRYWLGPEGITVSTALSNRMTAWREIQDIGVFPVSIRPSVSKNYILIFLSGKNKKLPPITLTYCFIMDDEILAIRYTEDRAKELEQFLHKELKIYTVDASGSFV